MTERGNVGRPAKALYPKLENDEMEEREGKENGTIRRGTRQEGRSEAGIKK